MVNDHLTPITSALLNQGDLIVTAWPRSDNGYDAFAFEITQTAALNKAITVMQDIAPEGTVTADQLREDGHDDQQSGLSGDNVYRLIEEEDDERLYHFGQLWAPNDLQIYWQNPNGELSQGFTRTTAIAEGDNEGWTVWSDNTQYSDKIPSTELETVILPGVTPFIGFQNKSEVTAQPTAHFFGKAYKVIPLNEEDLDLAVRVVTGLGAQRDLKFLGGVDPFNVSTPDAWGDEISLTADELAKILRVKITPESEQDVFESVRDRNR